jgi:Ser/Thr protein kinase RdoA (MazF antagonist)
MANWLEDVAESRRTIREVRQRLLSDEEQIEVLRNFPIAWASDFETREIQTRWSCVHGDLHGINVLVASHGRAVLIDYGDVGEGPAKSRPGNA